MIKIPPSALLSVVLLVVSVGAVGTRTTDVNVVNFPLDEQGNLRTSVLEPEPRTIVVVQNRTFDAGGAYIASANVEGYHYVSIFVSYRRGGDFPYVLRAQPSCANITRDWDGLQNIYGRVFQLYPTGSSTSWENIVSTGFEVGAPYIGFWLEVQTSIELTIVLYCYN